MKKATCLFTGIFFLLGLNVHTMRLGSLSCCLHPETLLRVMDTQTEQIEEVAASEVSANPDRYQLICAVLSENEKEVQKDSAPYWTPVESEGEKSLISLRLANGRTLKVTPNHLIATSDRELVCCENLKPGDNILDYCGNEVGILSLEQEDYNGKVFNFRLPLSNSTRRIIAEDIIVGDLTEQEEVAK